MVRFLLQRLIRLVGVLACVIVLAFAMVHLVPGDPAHMIAGMYADGAAVERVRQEFGLDRPLGEQFLNYIAGVLRGDLGVSFRTREPVSDVIAARIGHTAALAGLAAVIIVVIGFPLGIAAGLASRAGRRVFEAAFSTISGAIIAVPQYLMATLLVFLFAVTWSFFPVAGARGFNALVLPAIAIALTPTVMVARVIRVRTMEILDQPYIRTARSKRLSPSAINVRHVLPNALPAGAAVGGVLFAGLVGGAVAVEIVFARPGLGKELVDSVIIGDYAVVQGIVLVVAASVVVVNTLVDIGLFVLDPQTRERQ